MATSGDNLINYFITEVQGEVVLSHSYSFPLVFLSFLVATIGSTLAMFVASVASETSSRRAKSILKLTGGIAFGTAVWSMHFIGMLAFLLCTDVSYHAGMTLISAVPAMFAGWVVLHWISRDSINVRQLMLGGISSGAGIGLMHYAGMFAMQMPASLRFDPFDFVLSILVAVALATLSLWSRYGLLQVAKMKPVYANSVAALVMGGAITTMHYMGMAAARFTGVEQRIEPTHPSDWLLLSIMVSLGAVSVLGFVASGVLMARLRDTLIALKLDNYELDAIIGNTNEGIVTSFSDGKIRTVNKAFETIFNNKLSVQSAHLADFLPDWHNITASKSEKSTLETLAKRSDGSEFPIRMTLVRFQSRLFAFYVGFIADLSDAKRIQQQLQHDANNDFLTNINNRRYFDEQLALELNRSNRAKTPLALIMMDIDHFKAINDTYGHLVGDRVLAFLALELKTQARAGDIVSRYGGEEFMVLLPNTQASDARRIAQRLRAMIEKLQLFHNGKNIHFTVSMGVTGAAEVGDVNAAALKMLDQVDQAMYLAKNSGRNCVKTVDDLKPA